VIFQTIEVTVPCGPFKQILAAIAVLHSLPSA
jgi:hypothetical protein